MAEFCEIAIASEQVKKAEFLFLASSANGREYKRESRGFLQRVILYTSTGFSASQGISHAVLRTKCALTPGAWTVYDVEHVLFRGARCVDELLAAADAHLHQFELAGASSFFSNTSTATAHYDTGRPLELICD